MTATEKHYTVQEVAEFWGLDEKTVRRLLRDQPGVLAITAPPSRTKRSYATLRIPASVLERFHEDRSRGWSLAKGRGQSG